MKNIINNINKLRDKINNNTFLKVLIIFIKVILYIIVISLLLVVIVQRVSNNKLNIFGYRIFSVQTGSMIPEYQIGDILISKSVDISELRVGDDITYNGEVDDFAGKIVTHRIVNITKSMDNKYEITTKGIANSATDPVISESQVIGKVVYKTVILSFIGRLMTNIVSYYIIFIIVSLLISYQIVRIIFDEKEDNNEE